MKGKTINYLDSSVVDLVYATQEGNKINNSMYLGVLFNGLKTYNYGIELDYKILEDAIELIPREDFI